MEKIGLSQKEIHKIDTISGMKYRMNPAMLARISLQRI